jgi:hypothetical protein
LRALVLAAGLWLVAGCQLLEPGHHFSEKALLQAVTASPEAVTLEIYWAKLPPEIEHEGADFWPQVQENRLPADLRRRLARNGLRAGVFGGALPTEVHELLNPDGDRGQDSTETCSLLKETGVWRRTRQLRPGDRIELKACEPKPSAPLLVARGGELTGCTLTNAQAYYRLEAEPTADGRFELSLTPEVRHGQAKPRWTPDETGVISPGTPVQDAKVFEDLALRVPLAAGETLLVTSMSDSPSLVGGYFHTADESTGARRKAILIRVVQTPRSNDFALDEDALNGDTLAGDARQGG